MSGLIRDSEFIPRQLLGQKYLHPIDSTYDHLQNTYYFPESLEIHFALY